MSTVRVSPLRYASQMGKAPISSGHRFAAIGVALVLSMVAGRAAWAQPQLMPHRPLQRGFGGLCDGGPLVCTRIDRIAFHAGADAIILPSTSLRETGFVASYGLSIGIVEHLEGGIFSNTAIWGQLNGSQTDTLWQQGPMRFSIKGLLWPWRNEPNQRFSVLLDFEYEARLPHFDGQNQLGLLTDLAALRAVGNLPLGLAEVGLSVGTLFDAQVGYGTPELGARVGFHLPFMTDTKVFAEGLVRGFAVWNKSNDPLPGALVPAKPIVSGGALALGLVTRPRRQVDFAVVAQVGFGDIAPLFLTLRGPLDFSMGEGYPYPQSLVVDIIREAIQWIAEQRRKLSEPLRQTCVLYGRNGQPIATMGHLTEDGDHCEFQGQRFRIGDTLYPDPQRRQVCVDPEATCCVGAGSGRNGSPSISGMDGSQLASPGLVTERSLGGSSPTRSIDPAVLQRLLNQGALGPIRGELDNRCILNEGDHQVSPIGHLSTDGEHCIVDRNVSIIKNGRKLRTKVQQIPIGVGQPVYRDPATGRVCLSQNPKSKRDCPVVLDAEHNRPLSSGTEAGYHGALAGVDWVKGKADQAKGVANLLTHPAELTTAARKATDRAEQAAKIASETLRDPNKARQAARGAWERTIDTAHSKWEEAVNWYNLPTQKKINSAAEGGVKGVLDVGVTAVAGAVIPGGGTGVTVAKEVEKDTAKGAAHLLEGKSSQALRPGQPFTRAGKKEVWGRNATKHDGMNKCESCGADVIKPQQHTKGITPPSHEGQVDHMTAKAKGGSGTPENGQLLCRDCNLEKSDK